MNTTLSIKNLPDQLVYHVMSIAGPLGKDSKSSHSGGGHQQDGGKRGEYNQVTWGGGRK